MKSTRRRYPGLSLAGHEALATQLYTARDVLLNLVAAWPKTSAPARSVVRLIRAVDATRAILDDELHRMDPAGYSPTVYYRNAQGPQPPPSAAGSTGAAGERGAQPR